MNTSINELLDKIGINSVALRNKDNIDPLGKDIRDALSEAKKQIRRILIYSPFYLNKK